MENFIQQNISSLVTFIFIIFIIIIIVVYNLSKAVIFLAGKIDELERKLK